MSSRFSTSIESLDILAAVVTLILFLWFFYNNMKHTLNKKSTFLLESLRLLTVLVILVTLFEPEIVKVEEKTEKPQLKILYDTSGSMKTEDVVADNGQVISREEKVKQVLAADIKDQLSDRFDVTIENFAGLEKKPGATNIHSSLLSTLDSAEKLRSVILISDGSWNLGKNPLDAAINFRSKNIPVFALAAGREQYLPDLVLEKVDAPTFGLVNEKILIPFSIRNHLDREITVNAVLTNTRLVRVEKSVRIGPGQVVSDSLIWQPKFEGKYDFELTLPVLNEEINKDNNAKKFSINVRQEQLKVLVIESKPRWEYRYLRNALQRDPGVTVHTLMFHQPNMKKGDGLGYLRKFPESREELSSYDVVFLGDVGVAGGQMKKEHLEMIRALVEKQGSGVVFMPGFYGHHLSWLDTEIADLLPVVFDESAPAGKAFQVESKLLLTAHGRDHLLTLLSDTPAGNASLWKQLPGFYWNAAVKKARVGSNVLAVHSSLRTETGRMPLLVTRPYGNGNTLFIGTDSAWRWRKGVEDKYHYRFWGQVVRWMANKRHMSYSKQVRLFYNPSRVSAGDKVDLQATILDKAGFPKSESVINCKIVGPDKREKQFVMKEEKGGWGLYKGEFSTTVPGDYIVKIISADKTVQYETTIAVSGETLEKVGEPANFDVMKDIARITKGQYNDVDAFASIVKTIREMPEEKPKELRIRIWNQWWWGGIIILLSAVYWVARKKLGLV
ncbi:MAG: hypothetical protein NE328_23105 [Lentisphaeraceae bacterium]|nr:hypothetical protein [Lentisphaeraceae bacterium]